MQLNLIPFVPIDFCFQALAMQIIKKKIPLIILLSYFSMAVNIVCTCNVYY
jgi:hypothetical protein